MIRLIDAEIGYLPGGGIGGTLDMPEVDFTYLRCTGAWRVPSAGVSIISQSHENLVPAEAIHPGDIVILSSFSQRRLRMILEHNAGQPSDRRIAGVVFTSTKSGARLDESIDTVKSYEVPALYVPDDTHSADEKVYKCIKNTKLQPYDADKNAQIVELFANHFHTESFLRAFDLGV